jgi:hypothetical protein
LGMMDKEGRRMDRVKDRTPLMKRRHILSVSWLIAI